MSSTPFPRPRPTAPTIATLRAGDEVRRRLRLHAQGSPDRRAPARRTSPLELRDRTGAIPARVFRDADCSPARFDRGDLVRVAGRVERFRDELQLELRAIARAAEDEADPAAFLPVAYRDLDELDGFLEHLAGEVRDPGFAGAARPACSATAPLRAALRRAPCTRGGHHAYLGGLLEHTVAVGDAGARDLHAAPAAGPEPAAHRGDRARPRQDARVHLRRRDRPHRRGPPARPRRARAAACWTSARADPARRRRRRLALAHCVLTHHGPRRRRAALRLTRGARAAPPQRARRRGQGRARARPRAGLLVHRAPLEAAHADRAEDQRPADEAERDPAVAEMRRVGHRRAQPLRHVGQRVQQRDDLKPAQRVQRGPRVEGRAGEEQRRQHDREDHVDLARLDRRAEDQADRRAGQRAAEHHRDEAQPADVAELDAAGQDDRGQRQDDQRADDPAHRRDDDLLHADQRRRQRRQQAVLDLLGEGELDDQRQRRVLQGRQEERERDDARQQLGAVAATRRADLGQHAAEDEQVEERLQQRLGQEAAELAAEGHPEVALAEREEGADLRGAGRGGRRPRRRGLGLGRGAHRRSLPVMCTNTSSSVPSIRRRSRTRALPASAAVMAAPGVTSP